MIALTFTEDTFETVGEGDRTMRGVEDTDELADCDTRVERPPWVEREYTNGEASPAPATCADDERTGVRGAEVYVAVLPERASAGREVGGAAAEGLVERIG